MPCKLGQMIMDMPIKRTHHESKIEFMIPGCKECCSQCGVKCAPGVIGYANVWTINSHQTVNNGQGILCPDLENKYPFIRKHGTDHSPVLIISQINSMKQWQQHTRKILVPSNKANIFFCCSSLAFHHLLRAQMVSRYLSSHPLHGCWHLLSLALSA